MDNKSNRSLLAMAGEKSLLPNNSKESFKPAPYYQPKQKPLPISPTAISIEPSLPTLFDPKQIIKKLGLGRLRKMQALVRGFLVRRQVYPRQLEEYLVAQSALELIVANVVYRQVSGMIVETVTMGHYDLHEGSEERMLEEYLYNAIIKRVIQKEFIPIARQAVYETAIYASRPQITFGFNLRDPLELTLFLRLNQIIEAESREVAEVALREEAAERRQLQVIDQLIESMGLVESMCEQIVGECLLQGVEEYVVEGLLEKIVGEGATVVAEVVYNQKINQIQEGHVGELVQYTEEWLLQECILALIADRPSNIPSLPPTL